MYIDFHFSSQGYNHLKVGKICQDASYSFSNDDVSIAVVADGHGSDNYPRTDRGSGFAVLAAGEAIREFAETIADDVDSLIRDSESYLDQLEKRILAKWHEAVEADLQSDPLTEAELTLVSDRYKNFYLNGERLEKAYGTTLIAVCQTKSYWFGIHIGDGKCVCAMPDGTMCEPIPWDEQCQQNITTSICDSDSFGEFRHYFTTELPLATFIGSDGVDDSYASSQELHDLYKSILTIFAGQGEEIGKKEVEDYLPTISRKGSGDDVSIAGLIDLPLPGAYVELLQTKTRLEAINVEYAKLEKAYNAEKNELSRLQREQTMMQGQLDCLTSERARKQGELDQLQRAQQQLWDAYDHLQKEQAKAQHSFLSSSQLVEEQEKKTNALHQQLDLTFDLRTNIIREYQQAQEALRQEYANRSQPAADLPPAGPPAEAGSEAAAEAAEAAEAQPSGDPVRDPADSPAADHLYRTIQPSALSGEAIIFPEQPVPGSPNRWPAQLARFGSKRTIPKNDQDTDEG